MTSDPRACVCAPEMLALEIADIACPEHGLVAFLRPLASERCACGDPADCAEAVHA